jgi:hypothetical protein
MEVICTLRMTKFTSNQRNETRMRTRMLVQITEKGKSANEYDHNVAIDRSMEIMAIAHELRRLVSACEDVVKAGVLAMNHKTALKLGHRDEGKPPVLLREYSRFRNTTRKT